MLHARSVNRLSRVSLLLLFSDVCTFTGISDHIRDSPREPLPGATCNVFPFVYFEVQENASRTSLGPDESCVFARLNQLSNNGSISHPFLRRCVVAGERTDKANKTSRLNVLRRKECTRGRYPYVRQTWRAGNAM